MLIWCTSATCGSRLELHFSTEIFTEMSRDPEERFVADAKPMNAKTRRQTGTTFFSESFQYTWESMNANFDKSITLNDFQTLLRMTWQPQHRIQVVEGEMGAYIRKVLVLPLHFNHLVDPRAIFEGLACHL
jgi:hypothetical protein